MQKLLGVGGLFALRLKESIDTFPDQVLPSRPACRSQSTSFYGDDLPWIKTPHTHKQKISLHRFQQLQQTSHFQGSHCYL